MLQVIGCSHHEVPPSQLGPVIGDREARLADLLQRHTRGEIRGAVLLTTCNRLEILLDTECPVPARELVDEPAHHDVSGEAAVLHLLRVASGLDSVVRGEDQIHGQLREAFKTAERHDLLSPRLRVLRNELVAAARDVRQRTGLTKCNASVASVAARELATAGSRLAVIGAGDTGRLALETLYRREDLSITLVNRTLSRAESVAQHFGVTAQSLASFLASPPTVDGILIAVHSDRPVLFAEHVRGARRVIDVSQPGVLSSCVRSAGCDVLDLDSIASRVASETTRHENAFRTAEGLTRGRARALHRSVESAGGGQRLARIVEQHLETARREVDALLATKLTHLSVRDQNEIRAAMLRTTKHNAHQHVRDLKEYVTS